MRTIALVQSQLDAAEELVRVLKRERKSLAAAQRMRERHQDPAYKDRLTAGMHAMLADPVRRAAFVASERKAARFRRKGLPPMTIEQRRQYDKVRGHGADRADAILAVFGA